MRPRSKAPVITMPQVIFTCHTHDGDVERIDVTETIESMSTAALFDLTDDSPEIHAIARAYSDTDFNHVFGTSSIHEWLDSFLDDDETLAYLSDDPVTLTRLAGNSSSSVRLLASGNPFTPRPAINRLCLDADKQVAIESAKHLRVSYRGHLALIAKAAEWSAEDREVLVTAIVYNPRALPIALSKAAALSDDASTRHVVEARLKARKLARLPL